MAFADGALRQVLPAEQEAEVRLSIGTLFSLSPDVRAESCRRALALPGLPPDLRARLLAQLFHNLVVAAAADQAQQLLDQAREAVAQTGDSAARFTLELAEATLSYISGRFETALARSTRRCGPASAPARIQGWCRRRLRCAVLAVMDRYDEALAVATESIRSAQRARQGWALHMFETWRGRQLVQLGQLADAAAALEGRFAPDDAHLVVSALDAGRRGRPRTRGHPHREPVPGRPHRRHRDGRCCNPACQPFSGTPHGCCPCRRRPGATRPRRCDG